MASPQSIDVMTDTVHAEENAAARVQLATARDTTKQKGNLMPKSSCRARYSLLADLRSLLTIYEPQHRMEVTAA